MGFESGTSFTPKPGLWLGLALLAGLALAPIGAYDPLDPNGNITIKWDVLSWTPDGYVAAVRILNFQKYRHIERPGWALGWTWARKEVIWSMAGAEATGQGDCSRFKGSIPHSCEKRPTAVDLLPGAPSSQRVANCCKGGVISSWVQDAANAVSEFQIAVGNSGSSNTTVSFPKNFTLGAPGPGYTCGPARRVKSSLFQSADGRRYTQALMTWSVVCTYSQFVANTRPTCCVSLSSFYNESITPCPPCTCGCHDNTMQSKAKGCVGRGMDVATKGFAPYTQCTPHRCPIEIHWHVESNYKEHWAVKLTIKNFNYNVNYTHWNIILQHPNFNKKTKVYNFNYKLLSSPYKTTDAIAMLWGVKFYNDILMHAGPMGKVQSELLFQKNRGIYNFKQGWAFPQRVYFNGDDCVLPVPNSFPLLPPE